MELYKREFLISRIRAGYIPVNIEGRRYNVYTPSSSITLRANEIYCQEYEKAIEEELFDDDDIYNFLVFSGLWSAEKEKEFNEIVPKHIEYWKIELYKNVLRSNTRDTIRKYLKAAKEEYSKLHSVRHSFDHVTCAGHASYVKNMFLISKCARYKGKRINWSNVDLNNFMTTYYTSLIDSDIIRELARTQPWSGLWPILKINGKIFENTNLSHEQQHLISWSTMYDRIYESPDCPGEDVIEDDDMLDGWLLIQRRQREADKKKHELENVANKKIANADDIFLVAETPADAQKIDLLNDPRARKIKSQRLREVKNSGQLLEQQLSDVKQKRFMQLQQTYSQKMKGN